MDVSASKRTLYRLLERALGRYTDIFVNISRYEFDRSIACGIPAHKSRLVISGIGEIEPTRPIHLPESRVNLLFAGRMDRAKGLDILLESMRDLAASGVHLYVAGEKVLEGTECPLLSNVTYLGWLSREELNSYLAAADALVMPSRWEGFGLAAVEAMRQSTAVIASDRGALPEIVVPGETGLIFPGDDPGALADILRGLNKDELKRWGAAGRARQRALFSIERVHAQLNDIYVAIS